MRPPPPFLAGPPEFTVGLRPIPLERWLAPDWEAAVLPWKRALLKERLDEVCCALPGAAAASREAARLMGAETLLEAAALVSDDLALLEQRDGAWVASALCLCSPTFFSAAEALGKSLERLHGPVPAPGLGARIARVFAGLRPGLVLERCNWTVQPGPERYTPQAAPLFARAARLGPAATADILHLRVERQTIRRLPETGAVVFTIRVSLDRLAAVLGAPATRAAFAEAWSGAPGRVRDYKRWPQLDAAVRALLERFEERA